MTYNLDEYVVWGQKTRGTTDHGKERMARQIYSLKSSAAVCVEKVRLATAGRQEKIESRTFCQEHVRYLIS